MRFNLIFYCVLILCHYGLYAQNLKWEKLPGDYDQNVLCVAQDSMGILLIGTKTGLFISSDEGQSWTKQKLDNIDSVEVTSIIVTTKGTAYAGTFGEGVFERESETGEWKNINDNVIYKNVIKLQKDIHDTIYIHTSYNKDNMIHYQIYKYLFNSKWFSWDFLETRSIFFKITDKNEIYVLNPFIYRFDIYTQKYIQIFTSFYGDPYCITIDKHNNIYLGTGSSVYKSVDNGKTFKYTPLLLGNKVIRSIESTNKNEIIAGTSESGIYYSNNGAESWQANNEGLTSLNINLVHINNNDEVFAATEDGIFKSHKPLNNKIETIGWIKKDKYIENKVFEINLSDVNFSNNDSLLFVMGDNSLKIISTEKGIFIGEKFNYFYTSKKTDLLFPLIFVHGKIVNIDDNKGVLINLSSSDDIERGILAVYYDLIADSITKVYYFSLYYASYCSTARFLNVLYNNNKLYYGVSGWCQWKYIESGGKLEIYDMLENKVIKTFDTGFRNYYAFSNKGEYAVYINQDSIVILDSNLKLVGWVKYIKDISKFKFTNDAKYLVGAASENRLIFWDVKTGEIYRILKGFSEESITDFAISKNDRYVITGSNDGVLRTWDITQGISIDSIIFPPSNYNWKISISNAGNQFVTGSDDGYIRLFKSDLLTEVKEIKNNANNNLIITPNPASGFITIQPSEGMKLSEGYNVQIFNVFGKEIISTPSAGADTPQEGNLRIDISNLQPGVYFIKIGERAEKFVKM